MPLSVLVVAPNPSITPEVTASAAPAEIAVEILLPTKVAVKSAKKKFPWYPSMFPEARV